jgi:hypothetical protein
MPYGPKCVRPQNHWHCSSLCWLLMALLMVRERSSSDGSCVIFLSFILMWIQNQMNECLTKSKYDHLLFTFFFVFFSPTERCSLENFSGPRHVIAVDF